MSLLELRKEIKERKPDFIRQDNPKRMKVNDKWRKPKGVHSKIRHKFKGRRKMPSVGYRAPFEVRGLHSSGRIMVIVSNVNALNLIDPKTQGLIISKNVGMRKKLDILKAAKEMKLHVLNLKADDHISKIETSFSLRKKEKRSKEVPKKDDKAAKENKDAKEAKDKSDQAGYSEEDKKKAEKKEKDKLLTQKV